jgi:hypothetical protein
MPRQVALIEKTGLACRQCWRQPAAQERLCFADPHVTNVLMRRNTDFPAEYSDKRKEIDFSNTRELAQWETIREILFDMGNDAPDCR